MSKRPNAVQYIVNLEAAPHWEHVEIVKDIGLGRVLCHLSRGTFSTYFVAKGSQVAKIKKGKGRLSVTTKMLQDGRIYSSRYGA